MRVGSGGGGRSGRRSGQAAEPQGPGSPRSCQGGGLCPARAWPPTGVDAGVRTGATLGPAPLPSPQPQHSPEPHPWPPPSLPPAQPCLKPSSSSKALLDPRPSAPLAPLTCCLCVKWHQRQCLFICILLKDPEVETVSNLAGGRQGLTWAVESATG